jgi:hypothetical protein
MGFYKTFHILIFLVIKACAKILRDLEDYLKAHPQAFVPYQVWQIFPTTFMDKF